MADDSISDFWATQSSSRHRASDGEAIRAKAREHARVLHDAAGDPGPTIDIGCGDGLLTAALRDEGVDVVVGCDTSASMVEAARRAVGERPIALRVDDADRASYGPGFRTWMSTAALGQYLADDALLAVLRDFADDPDARLLVLFDMIDPLLYRAWRAGARFDGALPVATDRARAVVALARAAAGPPRRACALETPGMGFAYAPRVLAALATTAGLRVAFTASAAYEYRYHATFGKRSA